MPAIEQHWYRNSLLSRVLLPLAWLYCFVSTARRLCYRLGLLRAWRLPVPVVIVGNLTVGGTGKTPLVIWLAGFLAGLGHRPGIVTRGYGGRSTDWPRLVRADSDPAEVGDESVLLARRTQCPVVAGPDRVRSARMLVGEHQCTIVVSDDGLQHYRLGRDFEIAVIDGARRFGNGRCLPAGPLREPLSRLQDVDARVSLGRAEAGEIPMTLVESGLQSATATLPADAYRGRSVHAVAGIGNNTRFFEHLRRLGMTITEHPFPDHHAYTAADLAFDDDNPVIMTEKDAVKCERLVTRPFSYLVVEAHPDKKLGESIKRRLTETRNGQETA